MKNGRGLEVFSPREGSRVYGLPPGADFIRSFVAGLEARLASHPPEAMARVAIWVNSRRAERSLREAFSEGPARILPRIGVLSDLVRDPVHGAGLPEIVPPLRRKLELARLIGALIAAQPGMAAETAAFDLADSLSELLDELGAAGLDPGALDAVDPGEHAAHWQRSLKFLGILKALSNTLESGDGQARLRAVTRSLLDHWSCRPPRDPIIVAGSTGSRGGSRAFMGLVARQPQGALVLPGFDFDLPSSIWARLTSGTESQGDHPQAALARLVHDLGLDPAHLTRWHEVEAPSPERNALVSLALRPAPVTDQWRTEGARLEATLNDACDGVTWVEAPDQRTEARVIAYSLRRAAEERIHAALITPDRTLARRVAAELDRWRLIPDDSAGRPLALTPPGVLLRLVADAMLGPIGAETLLTVLKHPLVNSAPGKRRRHMDLVSRLETGLLRGGQPHVDWSALTAWAESLAARSPDASDAPAWVGWLETVLLPLENCARAPLSDFVSIHRCAVEGLAAGPERLDAHALWQKDAGQACLALMEEMAAEAPRYVNVRPSEYRALLASQMSGRDVPEEAVVTNARVSIWGALEARVQTADLVILGGLNEGTWPSQPGADPWLNRAMRREVGLPLPEVQIGLAAHDFQQAMGAGQVMVTHARRDAEAPTVTSRWLLRLENLLRGLGESGTLALETARARGKALLAEAACLDVARQRVSPARRPSPCPPVAARPSELSVTQLEELVRDPYAIYARKVLGLKRLDPPGRAPDALSRGSAIHAALQLFVDRTVPGVPGEARELFLACAEESLAKTAPWPAVRAIWYARFTRTVDWFLEEERARREFARPAAREIRGRRNLDRVPHPFAVTAKADRIDITPGGGYAIYDYKSGNVPSDKEIAAFHLQLPLEAAIAGAGGFEGLAASHTERLRLIGLNARRSADVPSDRDCLETTWGRLAELISAYQTPQQGYTARLRPQRLIYESDFDHLSRRGEWSDGDAAESGA